MADGGFFEFALNPEPHRSALTSSGTDHHGWRISYKLDIRNGAAAERARWRGKRTGCFRAALEIIAPLHPAALIPGDDFGIVLADLLSPISGVDNQDSNGGRDDNKLRVLKHALGWNIATPPKESPDHQSNGYPNSHIPWLHPGSIPHVLYDRKWASAEWPGWEGKRSGGFGTTTAVIGHCRSWSSLARPTE